MRSLSPTSLISLVKWSYKEGFSCVLGEEKDVQRVTENDETRDVHTRVLEACH